MSGLSLRELAVALGGEIVGRQVNCPGPNHSRNDRSLSVRPSPQSSTGYVVHSHCGDDFQTCKDFVAMKLGLPLDAWRTRGQGKPRAASVFTIPEAGTEVDQVARIKRAVAIWDESGDAHGTVVEIYLKSRGLDLNLVGNVNEVIRFHPRCPWGDKALRGTIFIPAMIACMRAIDGDRIIGIHRTRLNDRGEKVDRMMLGKVAGTVIKIDGASEDLVVGEGLETCLAARQMGLRPVWAAGSTSTSLLCRCWTTSNA